MLLLIIPSLTAFLEKKLPRALFFSENFSLTQILEDLTDFLIAVAAGGAILSCYVGLLAYIGSDTGLSNITGVRKAPMVVAAGALIGNFVHHGISSINAIIAACVCYSVSAFAAHSKINRISSDLPQCRTLF